jgi:methionine biosynthesis protein MetW
MSGPSESTGKHVEKRTVEMQVIGEWVEPQSRVLDLGCGRGELMSYLIQAKKVAAVGVDLDFDRISACVERGLSAYQGDMTAFMRAFPDNAFDRVICSRTAHELNDPAAVILEALRVSKTVTVGFVNHGFWKNRLNVLFRGRKVRNAVYTTSWHDSRPANPLTIADFEDFCREKSIRVTRRALLLGDWRTRCSLFPNLLAGYALYDLARI